MVKETKKGRDRFANRPIFPKIHRLQKEEMVRSGKPLTAEKVRSLRARFTTNMLEGVRRLFVLKANMKCWRPKSHCSLGYEEGQVSECHVHYEQVSTRSETLGPENKHEMLETKIPL